MTFRLQTALTSGLPGHGWRALLGSLLGLGALGRRAADVVLGDPGLVVALVSTSGDAGRLGPGQRLSGFDRLLALLDGARSALGLREEGLDPGLVDEVESSAEDSGQEYVQEDAILCPLAGYVR